MKVSYSIIEDKNTVIPLYRRYLAGIPSPYNARDVLASLQQLPDYFIIGIYHDDLLVGFLDGHKLTDKVHRLLNVYKGDATARQVLKVQKTYEEEVLRRGYVGWFSQSFHTDSIMEKLGAQRWEWKH